MSIHQAMHHIPEGCKLDIHCQNFKYASSWTEYNFSSSFFLSFWVWPLLPTHCRCRGLLLHLITLNDTHTHTLSRAPLDEGLAHLRPLPDNTQHSQGTDIHVPGGIRTRNSSQCAAADPRLRPHGHWNRRRIMMSIIAIPVRSSSKSSSVRTSVLLQQLSSSSGDSAGQHHRGLHHCSSGSDSPPNSLLVTDPTECTKGSTSPDSSSTSSANSHSAGRPVTRLQLKQKNQLYKLNSAGKTISHSPGLVTMLQANGIIFSEQPYRWDS
jgi:hypothetical protein